MSESRATVKNVELEMKIVSHAQEVAANNKYAQLVLIVTICSIRTKTAIVS